jgi:hypothetical protein
MGVMTLFSANWLHHGVSGGWYWRAKPYSPGNESVVDFEVYEVAASRGKGALLFFRKGGNGSSDLVESVADAELAINGTIKWDGTIYFATDGIDFGWRGGLAEFNALMLAIIAAADAIMPNSQYRS